LEWNKAGFMISDDPQLIDRDAVFSLLSNTYWGENVKREIIEQGIDHSHCFGIYQDGNQIGFTRVITDKAVFSWILDVVIDENSRGNGLGKWLLDCILNHPDLKHTKFRLTTKDAHEFYRKFGFEEEEILMRPRLNEL
jgi:GNAT superfamily N-acetyltransferase